MAVDRCICCDVTLAHALACARTLGVRTVGALQPHLRVGAGCGRCIPYVQRAIMTGETVLPVLGDREAALLLERADVRLLGEEE